VWRAAEPADCPGLRQKHPFAGLSGKNRWSFYTNASLYNIALWQMNKTPVHPGVEALPNDMNHYHTSAGGQSSGSGGCCLTADGYLVAVDSRGQDPWCGATKPYPNIMAGGRIPRWKERN
jgi:hypothetical protein